MPQSGVICDYEGATYRQDFWEGADRRYEDLAERRALGKLLPLTGRRILELGAGFGRLADLYGGYEEAWLLDWSRSLLAEARDHLGAGGRYHFLACNLINTPFPDGYFDTLITVRVLHYVPEPSRAFAEARRLLAPGGTFVVEAANKRHLKALLRYALGRGGPNPWSLEPVEVNPHHFNFHPRWMEQGLREAGFAIERRLSVSLFRHERLKRWLPAHLLAGLEARLQAPLGPLALGPSLFYAATAVASPPAASPSRAWRCPICAGALAGGLAAHVCGSCGRLWPIESGIHNFKE